MNLPTQAALARYGAIKVTTANPGQILLMLYDGLLRFLREARMGIQAKDRKRACERISRSHAILVQLLGSLDATHAPALCQHLQAVYMFCMQHLLRANIEQSEEKIGEVINVLSPLRDAWMTAVTEVSSSTPR